MDTQVTRTGVQQVERIAPLYIPGRKSAWYNKDELYKHHSFCWTNSRLQSNLLPDESLVQVEDVTHFLQSLGSAHRPKTLEFSVVEPGAELVGFYKVRCWIDSRQAHGDDSWKEM